jgi:hypothetical protein
MPRSWPENIVAVSLKISVTLAGKKRMVVE